LINFRYHVVSLTAVFLALAIGLVVGTTALNGPAAETLSNQVKQMRSQNDQYRDKVNQLTDEAGRQEQFAREATPYLVRDKLVGRRVLLITTSDAEKQYADQMMQTLALVGAKVTGQLSVQQKFLDPANNEQLLDLADRSLPPGVTGLPANSNGVETSSALLAAVLMDRATAVPAEARRTVLAAFRDFIRPGQEVTGPAETVLLLAGAPYADRDAAKLNAALVHVADQFDKAAPLVVAGDGVGGDGNLIKALRGDPALSKSVSTVDNIATPQGRVVTALAIVEQFEGRAGHYGIGGGATSFMPKSADERARSGS
jgi:copper transport outer membrane protein MctB